MKEIININPTNYVEKLKEHVAVFVTEAKQALKNAQELVIKTDDDLRLAKEDWVKHRDRMKEVEADRKDLTVPLNAAIDMINSTFKEASGPYTEARDILNRKAAQREREIREAQEEEDRKAREKAKKEEDRIRKENEAKEAELRKKEEAKRREAEELAAKASKTKDESKKAELEAQAEKARQAADLASQKADQKAQAAAEAFVPAITVEKTVVKVSGAKAVTRYFFQVVDATKVPIDWNGKMLRPVSESALGEIAKGLKLDNKAPSPIPGVRFWSEAKLG